MVRTKKKIEASAPAKSKLVVVRKKTPIAKKTFKGNVTKTAKRTTTSLDNATPSRRSTRTPRKIERFTESIPSRQRSKSSTRKQRKNESEETVVKKRRSVKRISKTEQANDVRQPQKRGRSKEKDGKKSGEVETPKKRRHKNDLLVPRSDIDDMQSNSYFYGKASPKFISVSSYGRIAHRLVLRKDIDGLKRAVADKAHFPIGAFNSTYSESSSLTPEGEAVLSDDLKFIDAILLMSSELSSDKQGRAVEEPVLLRTVSCLS
ncbi:unnamed protein product [Toxocara canis]|uniref:BRCT domain-containing protein n=1 Tax=Toxocara canis TaxID=6265 RepID=A0A183VFW6_TOXCA|nr:unnamed protein product [Toxocara canis]